MRKLLLFGLMLFVFASLPIQAQTPVSIISDTDLIYFFELYGPGLYYWRTGSMCDPTPVDGTIRLVPYLEGNSPRVVNLAKGCYLLNGRDQNIVRGYNYLYFFDSRHLMRLANNAGIADLPQDLPEPISISDPAYSQIAIYYTLRRLYWCSQDQVKNQTYIHSANIEGGDQKTELRITPLTNIKELKVYAYNDAVMVSHRAIFFLTGENNLYKHELTADDTSMTFLGEGISYFTLQRLPDNSDRLYCIKSATPTRLKTVEPFSHIWSINPDSGYALSLYTSPTTNYITSLCTDNHNVYWTEMEAAPGASTNCHIKRKSIVDATPLGTMLTFTGTRCDNIRSDGTNLYYIIREEGVQTRDIIQRLGAGTPVQQLDFRADSMEVVQHIQNSSNSVNLIARKPTYVRGYAHIVINQMQQTSFRPGARLYGTYMGADLPGSPLNPINDSIMDSSWSNLADARGDVNKCFLFELPASWTQHAGEINLSFKINPHGIVPETGTERNIVNYTATFYQKGLPCIVLIPVSASTGPTPDLVNCSNLINIGRFFAEAEKYMPIERFSLWRSEDTATNDGNPFNFSLDHEDSRALSAVADIDSSTDNPDSCNVTHYNGVLHRQGGGINGIGYYNNSDMDSVVRYEDIWGPTDYNTPWGSKSLAHELTHNYGSGHINNSSTCGGSPAAPYNTYPFDTCRIGTNNTDGNTYFGFDTFTRSIIKPEDSADLMSYGNHRWTSSATWSYLWSHTPSRSLGENDNPKISKQELEKLEESPLLYVSGLIDSKKDTVEYNTFYLYPPGEAPSEKVARSVNNSLDAVKNGSPYTVKILDHEGKVISETAVGAKAVLDDPNPSNSSIMGVGLYAPAAFNLNTIQFLNAGTIIGERIASGHAPVLTLNLPVVDNTTHKINMSWSATDEDGDPLRYMIQYSADGGSHYRTVALNYIPSEIEFDTTVLPGSTNARIRVTASDGVLTDMRETDIISVTRNSPFVSISGIREGERIPFSRHITLTSFATDAEDGGYIPDERLAWTALGPSILIGSGPNFSIDYYAPGIYTVDLAATDSDANTNHATVHFEYLPLDVPEGVVLPALDGYPGDDVYLSGRTVRIPITSDLICEATLLHSGGKLCIGFSSLKCKGGTSPNSFVGIRIDKNNSGDLLAQSDDLGFFVDEYGVLIQARGDGAGNMNPISDPSEGFEARVHRGEGVWSAELQINDSLLNGWNHAARIKLGEYWIDGQGDDRNWPQFSIWNSPFTWAPAWFGSTLPAPENRAPIANAGADQRIIADSAWIITLDGFASYDPDGDSITYSWSQFSGLPVTLNSSTTASPSFIAGPYSQREVFQFDLTVNDGALGSAPDRVEISVGPSCTKPVVDFLATPHSGWAPLMVSFTYQSYGNGRNITGYEWCFDRAWCNTIPNQTITFEHPGLYAPTLTVWNRCGGYNSKSCSIRVNYHYPFDNVETEGWTPYPLAAGTFINDPTGSFYVAPTSTATPSSTGIIDNTSSNLYGSWELKMDSPMQDCEQFYLYRARFHLRTEQTNTSLVPQVRLRWNDTSSLTVNAMMIDKGTNAITSTDTPYDLFYFKSPGDGAIGQNFLIYWDLVDFTPQQTGNIFCSSVDISRRTLTNTGETLIMQADTTEDFANWTTFNASPILDTATGGRGSGSLWLESPGPLGSHNLYYSGWSSPYNASAPAFQSGYIYLALFKLRTDAPDVREHLPMIRLRFSNQTFDWVGMKTVRQVPGSYSHMPTGEGLEYYIYMPPPPHISGTPGDANDLMVLNFDIVDGEASQYGRVYLEKLQIYRYTTP